MQYYEDIVLLMSSMSIAEMAAEYAEAWNAYRSGNPTMTDEEFDRLEDRLRKVAPFHEALNPDAMVLPGLRKNRMQSFDEWYSELPGRPVIAVQPKIDGIAIGLRYVDGELVRAQTKRGRCAFDLVQLVPSIPRQLKRKAEGTMEIHGELWGVPKDSGDQRTPQSIAAVSARFNRVSGSGLLFSAYRLIGSLCDESKSMEDLRRLGFDVPDTIVCTKPGEVRRLYEQWKEGHCGSKQPFNTKIFRTWPTDGVVCKIYDQRAQRKIGADDEAPRWAIALKKNGRA